MAPSITFVIPHYESYPRYQRCLSSVLSLIDQNCEVLTVGDGASPEEYGFLENLGVKILRLESNLGAGQARNRGAQEARGDFLLFLDSDVSVTEGFISAVKALVDSLRDRQILQGVYSDVALPQNVATQYKNLYYCFNFSRRIGQSCLSTLSSHCFLIRRSDFLELNGFDGRMPGATVEDSEFGLRAARNGFRILIAADLKVVHHKAYSLGTLLRTDFTLCRAKMKTLFRHLKDVFLHPSLITVSGGKLVEMKVIVFSVFAAPLTLVFLCFSPPAGVFLLAALLVFNSPFYCFLYQKRGLRMALASIGVSFLDYLCAFLGMAAGAVEFIFFGKRY